MSKLRNVFTGIALTGALVTGGLLGAPAARAAEVPESAAVTTLGVIRGSLRR